LKPISAGIVRGLLEGLEDAALHEVAEGRDGGGIPDPHQQRLQPRDHPEHVGVGRGELDVEEDVRHGHHGALGDRADPDGEASTVAAHEDIPARAVEGLAVRGEEGLCLGEVLLGDLPIEVLDQVVLETEEQGAVVAASSRLEVRVHRGHPRGVLKPVARLVAVRVGDGVEGQRRPKRSEHGGGSFHSSK
jgi:hypothetical protein